MIDAFTTACPRNCYSTCGMQVTKEDGKLRLLETHPDNLATSEGLCLKGLSYIERVYSPDRLLHPLKRTTDGGFEQYRLGRGRSRPSPRVWSR